MAVEIRACETCGSAARETTGQTLGEQLLTLVREAASESDVRVTGTRCLWACKRSCAVHLSSPGRVGYVLCELSPSEENARALIDYARAYGKSADGAVPYRDWPLPLRGHFLCRIPPTAPTSNEDPP